MVTLRVRDRVKETSASTGTGVFTCAGPAVGFSAWSLFADGATVHYAIVGGTEWEVGVGSKSTSSGSSIITRNTVLANSLGDLSKIAFSAGTKDVFSTIPAAKVGMVDQDNTWSADQYHAGNKIRLDADGNTYLWSPSDNVISLVVAGVENLRYADVDGSLWFTTYDGGSGVGPNLNIFRDSASPAANDDIGAVSLYGRDSANGQFVYARLAGTIVNPASGAKAGRMNFLVMLANALVNFMSAFSNSVILSTGWSFFTAGKTATALGTVGAELRSDGMGQFVVDGGTCVTVNRLTNDGTLISLRQANTEEGAISVSGTTITYGTFTGIHNSDWKGKPPTTILEGTVVESTEGVYNGRERLPLVKIAKPGSKRVYGVYLGEQLTEEGTKRLVIASLGCAMVRAKGKIEAGDFLTMSDEDGIAARQTDGRMLNTTIGKATQNSDGDDPRLVPCTVHCG